MARIYQVTSFLHVPDLGQAVDFFTRVLRFEVKFRMDTYAYLECQNVRLPDGQWVAFGHPIKNKWHE